MTIPISHQPALDKKTGRQKLSQSTIFLLIIACLLTACSRAQQSEKLPSGGSATGEIDSQFPGSAEERQSQPAGSATDVSPGDQNGYPTNNPQNKTSLNDEPALAWKGMVGDGLAAPAKLAGDHVIVASHQGLFAFDPQSGRESWRYLPEGGIWSKSLAVGDGRIFSGVPGGLVALDASDGRELYFVPTDGEVLWAPLVEKSVFVATAFVGPGVDPDPEGQAWAYALDPVNGELLWSAETEAYSLTSPAIGAETVYVGGSRLDEAEVDEGGHMRIHAYNKDDGTLLWTVDRTDGFLKSLTSDGERLYYLAYTDMLYALEAESGEDLWRYPTENWSPGLTELESTLYFGSDNAFVHAVSGEDGQAMWRTAMEGTFNSPRGRPAVDQDSVYFQGNDNRLYALERDNGEIRWISDPQPRSRTAVAIGDGQLYLSGQDGMLYVYR